ncbi:MAG: hypothetical protein RMJ51_06525 [Candidatus Calescibacterium sp.]|nr:hypothetical protein [Candidatus Calescibacterium sp.]MCX7972799.1 hypothetical protein [bacterium]MDW8195873.1 hypothetical protein [Candidatus Calescibacterium sp.]
MDLENRIANICKEYNLEGIAIFFLESLVPFRRIIGHIIVFSEPFLSIFLNTRIIEELYELFYDEKRYNKLYQMLIDKDKGWNNLKDQ